MYDSYPERQRDWPDEASATGKNPVPIPAKLRALKDKRMVQALLYPRTNPLLSKEGDFFRALGIYKIPKSSIRATATFARWYGVVRFSHLRSKK